MCQEDEPADNLPWISDLNRVLEFDVTGTGLNLISINKYITMSLLLGDKHQDQGSRHWNCFRIAAARAS